MRRYQSQGRGTPTRRAPLIAVDIDQTLGYVAEEMSGNGRYVFVFRDGLDELARGLLRAAGGDARRVWLYTAGTMGHARSVVGAYRRWAEQEGLSDELGGVFTEGRAISCRVGAAQVAIKSLDVLRKRAAEASGDRSLARAPAFAVDNLVSAWETGTPVVGLRDFDAGMTSDEAHAQSAWLRRVIETAGALARGADARTDCAAMAARVERAADALRAATHGRDPRPEAKRLVADMEAPRVNARARLRATSNAHAGAIAAGRCAVRVVGGNGSEGAARRLCAGAGLKGEYWETRSDRESPQEPPAPHPRNLAMVALASARVRFER